MCYQSEASETSLFMRFRPPSCGGSPHGGPCTGRGPGSTPWDSSKQDVLEPYRASGPSHKALVCGFGLASPGVTLFISLPASSHSRRSRPAGGFLGCGCFSQTAQGALLRRQGGPTATSLGRRSQEGCTVSGPSELDAPRRGGARYLPGAGPQGGARHGPRRGGI